MDKPMTAAFQAVKDVTDAWSDVRIPDQMRREMTLAAVDGYLEAKLGEFPPMKPDHVSYLSEKALEAVARALWVDEYGAAMGAVFDRIVTRGTGDTGETQSMWGKCNRRALAAITAYREAMKERAVTEDMVERAARAQFAFYANSKRGFTPFPFEDQDKTDQDELRAASRAALVAALEGER